LPLLKMRLFLFPHAEEGQKARLEALPILRRSFK
jgi:hypothetical protein